MKKTAATDVELVTRAKVYKTETAKIRRWRSKCGRWAVTELTSLYGLPRLYLVLKIEGGESIVSRHRTKTAAAKALGRLS